MCRIEQRSRIMSTNYEIRCSYINMAGSVISQTNEQLSASHDDNLTVTQYIHHCNSRSCYGDFLLDTPESSDPS